MPSKKLLQLSLCAIFFGSIYTIFRKYQSCAQLSDPDKTFNQPLYFCYYSKDSVVSYLCRHVQCWALQAPVEEWKWEERASEDSEWSIECVDSKEQWEHVCVPVAEFAGSCGDGGRHRRAVLRTIFNLTIQTSVSVSQMLKGSVIFFTYLISIIYLKKSLSLQKHLLMVIILLSLFLIASSNL